MIPTLSPILTFAIRVDPKLYFFARLKVWVFIKKIAYAEATNIFYGTRIIPSLVSLNNSCKVQV
jgi:hypothetical protein